MAVQSYNSCSVKHGIQYALQRSKGANCVDLSLSWQGWDSRGVDFFNWSRHFFWPFCLNIDFFIFSNCFKGHYLLTKNHANDQQVVPMIMIAISIIMTAISMKMMAISMILIATYMKMIAISLISIAISIIIIAISIIMLDVDCQIYQNSN